MYSTAWVQTLETIDMSILNFKAVARRLKTQAQVLLAYEALADKNPTHARFFKVWILCEYLAIWAKSTRTTRDYTLLALAMKSPQSTREIQ